MRFRYLVPVACAAALVLPSSASADFTVGISENQPSMFADPVFASVGFKHARVIVGWDVALDPASAEFGRVRDYLAGAQAAGIEPLVSFQHTRGDSSRCNKRKNF